MKKDCCQGCRNYRPEINHEEPVPKVVYIAISKREGRRKNYKNSLIHYTALEHLFLDKKTAQDMTRVWGDGFIAKCEIIEDISNRRQND